MRSVLCLLNSPSNFNFLKGRLPHAVLHWMCLEFWNLDDPTFFYKLNSKALLEVLRGAQLLLYHGWKNSIWEGHPF